MTTQPKLRTYPSIPVFIVENHNEVLEFVYAALGSRHLPFRNNTIIHFDSHPDMTIPRNMPAEFVYDKQKLLDAVNIESWLMPPVFAGHFSKLLWMKPSWAKQIPDGNHSFLIGRHDGCIRVSSPLEYFVSEGSYQPEHNLLDAKTVQLTVVTVDENGDSAASPLAIAETDEPNSSFVLDIDLDFFSTHNPFLNLFEMGNVYGQLKEIFYYKMCDNVSEPNAIVECAEQRVRQLDELEKVFRHLTEKSSLATCPVAKCLESVWARLEKLVESVHQHYNSANIDWPLIYDAGCTCDSTDLPHHKSTQIELENLLKAFKKILQQINGMPVIVTISRSSDDDYCPADQVEWIQESVLTALRDVYGDKLSESPILRYKDE